MNSLIICKKCGGPHITLKCGKNMPQKHEQIDTKLRNNNTKHYETNDKHNKTKYTTVRISNLPNDIIYEELSELVYEWGKIGRINITNNENKSAFIDFYYKDEAEYFVKALDRTPFDSLIINVEILDKNY
jgi:RNA recognition motif-containing protein